MSKKKTEHLDLAIQSQLGQGLNDTRFDYEALLSPHPETKLKAFPFLGKEMKVPIWISSMTGGSEYSGIINKNLARACNEFGLGMGLGSCRVLLEEGNYFDHFNLREIIGDDYPFYANLGIKQIENAVLRNDFDSINCLCESLKVDGLIIHVNPLQEWLQPEGERITISPLETIKKFLESAKMRVIVKEVGQGMGPASIKELLKMPLEAIELAAFGGTNFAKLELNRSSLIKQKLLEPLSLVGNNAGNMIDVINQFAGSEKDELRCKSVIISGGLNNFLDGYYYMQKSVLPSVYGQASTFLKYAREDYSQLREFIQYQISGLELATAYLRLRD
ncbi:MAG: hypothetical protein K9H12_03750 [Bacteroidales bacterium]|nr:hypothetical protein [Bacteroidales bacterium]